jgi:hypothetical protein
MGDAVSLVKAVRCLEGRERHLRLLAAQAICAKPLILAGFELVLAPPAPGMPLNWP